MAEYIERESAIKKLNNIATDYIKDNSIQCSIAAGTVIDIRDNVIMKAPAADVVEVIHAYWEKDSVTGVMRCSNCRMPPPGDAELEDFYESPYCQSCGAKMNAADINVGCKNSLPETVKQTVLDSFMKGSED